MLNRSLILAFFATSVLGGFASIAVAGLSEDSANSVSTANAAGAANGSATATVTGFAVINGGRVCTLAVYAQGPNNTLGPLIQGTVSNTPVAGTFKFSKTYNLPPGDYISYLIFSKPDGTGGTTIITNVAVPFTVGP